MAAVCPGEEKDRGQPSPTVPKSPTSLRKGQARRSGSRQNSGTSLAKLAAPGVRREGGDRVGWGGRDTGSNFAAPPPSSELRQFRILPPPPHLSRILGPRKAHPFGPASSPLPAGPRDPRAAHSPRGHRVARPPVLPARPPAGTLAGRGGAAEEGARPAAVRSPAGGAGKGRCRGPDGAEQAAFAAGAGAESLRRSLGLSSGSGWGACDVSRWRSWAS